MSSSVFSATLQNITTQKLAELSKRRSAFEEAKALTLSSVQLASDPFGRLVSLRDGLKNCLSIKTDKQSKVIKGQTKYARIEDHLTNLDRFLAQAQHDPSVTPKMMADWEKPLLHDLDTQSMKFQYATLYGQLVTEWLSSERKRDIKQGYKNDGDDEDMVDIGSASRLQSKVEWEAKTFEPGDVDVEKLRSYLNDLFFTGDPEPFLAEPGTRPEASEKERKKRYALDEFRNSVEAFEAELSRPNQFNLSNMHQVINGLLASETLDNENREVLNDFLRNEVILSEIADILNMRIAEIRSWNWEAGGVPVEYRRKINGVFSVHMQEDLLQAIFLQYIGVKWSSFLRTAFTKFRDSDAWCSLYQNVPDMDRRRLESYLGALSPVRSVQMARQKIYNQDYFVAKLARGMEQAPHIADGEVEAKYANAVSRNNFQMPQFRLMSARQAPLETTDSRERGMAVSRTIDFNRDRLNKDNIAINAKTPMSLKQQALHLLSTDMAINTRLHGEFTAFHAVFDEWETLLPHETIFTILEFFGITQPWLGFMKNFLQAPLKSMDEEDDVDASTPPRIRRRGVPSAHALTEVFSETILFCLDFAVNQTSSGQPLWRLGDDMFFWTADHNIAVTVWSEIQYFAAITGTSINDKMSGSVRITGDSENIHPQNDKSLPVGDIRWGFLVLSPQSARFEIDQEMVDIHIDELRKQLNDEETSIFEYVKKWNAYVATFLSSNFGEPANCFGRQHVDDMLATHKRVQECIFSKTGSDGTSAASSIADYLKTAIGQRFGIKNIPDGFLYFPANLGGLDLQSPFISLLQIHDSVLKSQDSLFQDMFEAERNVYNRFKIWFESSLVMDSLDTIENPVQHLRINPSENDEATFLSFEEFIQYREELCTLGDYDMTHDILAVFETLLSKPNKVGAQLEVGSATWMALADLVADADSKISINWQSVEPYWKWVTMMYGPEIVETFGGLSIIDRGLLPMGMVDVFKGKKATWRG